MNILLTGASGFLGSHIARALLADGHQIIALKRQTSDLWRLKDTEERIHFYNLEELDLEQPFKRHGQINAVIHTATCYGRKNEPAAEVFETNTVFPLRLLETATLFNTDTFFNTDTILSAHLNYYALSKKQFTEWGKMLCGAAQTRFFNIRLENMYGPGDDLSKFTSWIMQQCLQSVAKIDLTAGDQQRDFIYIDDVVAAYRLLLSSGQSLQHSYCEIELGSGTPITIRNFVESVCRLSKSKSQLNFGKLPYRNGEIMHSSANLETLKRLGWRPITPLETGILETLRSMGLEQDKT